MKKGKLRPGLWAGVACALLALSSASAAAAAPLPVPVVIDDFTTGARTITSTAPSEQIAQTGSMKGGARCIVIDTAENPFQRPNTVTVAGGHMFVETGVRVGHSVTLLYGWDQNCANDPMDLDLTNAERFRIEFEQNDLSLAGGMVVWTASGISSVPICMIGITADSSFHCDMPFSAFSGTPDWEHVQYIAIVLESGGGIFSHDYAINSISAVRDPNAPAGQHPSTTAAPLRTRPVATPVIPQRGR